MAITITGSKASGTISSVGTTTLNGAGFSASDYSIPRLTALFDSVDKFKGIAYIRKYVSATQLELETDFFDPVNDAFVTQVTGDKYMISKNLAESTTTGLSVSGNTVTITDTVTIGTTGQPLSAFVYDEGKLINHNGNFNPYLSIEGGLFVLGHYDPNTETIYNTCEYYINNTVSFRSGIVGRAASGGYVHYGGKRVIAVSPVWNGGAYTSSNQQYTGPSNHTHVIKGVTHMNDDLLSPSQGGDWTNDSDRHVVSNPTVIANANSAIPVRWGNGIVSGGLYKFTSTEPLTMFGGSGILNFGAKAGERLVVVDLFGNSMGDGYIAGTVFNFTNTLAPVRNIERGNGTASQNYYWNEQYSNLAENTRVVIERDVDKVIADSEVVATNGVADLTILEATYTGLGQPTPNPEYTAWNFGILGYGKQIISGNFSRITQSLGVGGTSFNVEFGGVQNQLNDTNITETDKATVDAYTEIDNLDKLYDKAKSWKVSSDTNLQYPSLSELLITGNGTALDLGNRNLVINGDSSGNSEAVGIEQGSHTLSAKTSVYSSPNDGRLNNSKTWLAHYNDTSPWLQVDLGALKRINRIATQGSPTADYWTTSYRLEYSADGSTFTSYNDGQTFSGNGNRNGIVAHSLTPFSARYVRIHPLSKNDTYYTLRVELYEDTSEALEVDKATNTITIKSSALETGDTFKTFRTTGTVTLSNNPVVDVQYIDSTNAGRYEITLSGLQTGDRVLVEALDGQEIHDGTATGSSITFSDVFSATFMARIRVYSDTFKEYAAEVTINEGSNNFNISLSPTYGIIQTDKALKSVDGVEIDASGFVSIDTTTKEITFEKDIHIREGLSILKFNWDTQDNLGGSGVEIPFDLDDIRGISINSDWTLSGLAHAKKEGFVYRDTDGNITELHYRLITKLNTSAVQSELIYGNASQGRVLHPAGELDTLIVLDHTQNDIELKLRIKEADEFFVVKEETIRNNGGNFQDKFRNSDTTFLQVKDASVTEVLAEDDTTFRYVPTSIVKTDNNGTSHQFTHYIELDNTSNSVDDIINQLASIAANNDGFDTKPYTKNSNGTLTVDEGLWLQYKSGSELSGVLSGLVLLSSTSGAFAFTEKRPFSIALPDAYVGVDVDYILVKSDSYDIVGTEPVIEVNADNNPIQGTLTSSNKSYNTAIEIDVDTDYVLIWGGENIQFKQKMLTLTPAGINEQLEIQKEIIELFKDETQTVSDISAGTLAWVSLIDDIRFDWPGRVVIIPDNLAKVEVSYLYRAWRKAIEADKTLMKYGEVLLGVNQEKDANSINNAHLFNPIFYFNNHWVFDVTSSRPVSPLLEVKSGDIERSDTQHRDNITYKSPLSNGSAPVFKIVKGASAQALDEIKLKTERLSYDDEGKLLVVAENLDGITCTGGGGSGQVSVIQPSATIVEVEGSMKQDFVISQGATWSISLACKSKDGSVRDLSDYSVDAKVGKYYNEAPVYSFGAVAGGINIDTVQGIVTLTMPAAETSKLGIGGYVYDVELHHSSGTIERILKGKMKIDPNI